MRIYAIAGKKRSGKTTVAKLMQDYYQHLSFTKPDYANIGAVMTLPLAEPIKMATASILEAIGIKYPVPYLEGAFKESHVHPLGTSPRRLMQVIGTEVGRTLNKDFWIDILRHRVAVRQANSKVFIVPDVRFENEAKALRQMGAVFIHVEREGATGDSHASESGIRVRRGDFVLTNNGTVDQLKESVQGIVNAVEELL